MASDETGAILYQCQAGSANLSSTPERVLISNLRKITEQCPQPDFVCGGFAGLITSTDETRAVEHLHRAFPKAQIQAVPDFAAAFYASDPLPDLCIISGTGSLICSLVDGKLKKSGGGGYIIGDVGSAFQIGRDAIRHYLYSDEEPTQAFLFALEEIFGTVEHSQIIARIYKTSSPAALIAKLAKPIGHEATAGLAYATNILNRCFSDLAAVVKQHLQTFQAERLKQEAPVQIVLAGGAWKPGLVFREAFAAQLQSQLPDCQFQLHLIQQPPVKGALKLAMRMSNSA